MSCIPLYRLAYTVCYYTPPCTNCTVNGCRVIDSRKPWSLAFWLLFLMLADVIFSLLLRLSKHGFTSTFCIVVLSEDTKGRRKIEPRMRYALGLAWNNESAVVLSFSVHVSSCKHASDKKCDRTFIRSSFVCLRVHFFFFSFLSVPVLCFLLSLFCVW